MSGEELRLDSRNVPLDSLPQPVIRARSVPGDVGWTEVYEDVGEALPPQWAGPAVRKSGCRKALSANIGNLYWSLKKYYRSSMC